MLGLTWQVYSLPKQSVVIFEQNDPLRLRMEVKCPFEATSVKHTADYCARCHEGNVRSVGVHAELMTTLLALYLAHPCTNDLRLGSWRGKNDG